MTWFKSGFLLGTVVCVFSMGASAAWARTWYVRATANAHADGRGTEWKPFTSLADVEIASRPGDTILVLPSHQVLDGGIALKNGQKLIGLGPQVTRVSTDTAHARISNSTNAHLAGDAIRLANDNTVRNLHIEGAYRGGVLGINVDDAVIADNLISENMLQHSLQTLQASFIIFQQQRNHYGAITLFACGSASPNECQDEDAATVGLGSARAIIHGNVIRDVNVEGIIILNDHDIVTNYTIADNSVDRVSLTLPAGFKTKDLMPPEVVRSRGFTILVGNGAHANVDMHDFAASHLAPPGDYASDGIVFVTFGDGAVVSADVSDVSVTNPDFTGEVANGDALEMTAFGKNAIFDVRVRRAVLRDTMNTQVKMLEIGPTSGNSYFFDIADSELTNVNPRVAVEATFGSILYRGTGAGPVDTNTIDISVRNTTMTGHRRGMFVNNANSSHIGTLHVVVEDSVMANNTQEGFRLANPTTLDNVIIDLGRGLLGSRGHNTFLNNNDQADLAIVNTTLTGPAIRVDAQDNYWGGGAPVTGLNENLFTSGPVILNASRFLTRDPNLERSCR